MPKVARRSKARSMPAPITTASRASGAPSTVKRAPVAASDHEPGCSCVDRPIPYVNEAANFLSTVSASQKRPGLPAHLLSKPTPSPISEQDFGISGLSHRRVGQMRRPQLDSSYPDEHRDKKGASQDGRKSRGEEQGQAGRRGSRRHFEMAVGWPQHQTGPWPGGG